MFSNLKNLKYHLATLAVTSVFFIFIYIAVGAEMFFQGDILILFPVIYLLFLVAGIRLFNINKQEIRIFIDELAQTLGLQKIDLINTYRTHHFKELVVYSNGSMGGIYKGFFLKIGFYTIYGRGTSLVANIVVRPEENFNKELEIVERMKEIKYTEQRESLRKEFLDMEGGALSFTAGELKRIEKEEIPKYYNYLFEFYIRERGVIFRLLPNNAFSKIDAEKFKEYADAAISLMKYTKI